jgi:hypothetical protein
VSFSDALLRRRGQQLHPLQVAIEGKAQRFDDSGLARAAGAYDTGEPWREVDGRILQVAGGGRN